MLKGDAHIATRAHNYGMPSTVEKGKEAENPYVPLQIKRMMGDTITHISKGAFKKASHNPNVRVTQNYFVVEDLSQTPCVMFSLGVLQRCPSQRKALLAALGSTETCNPGTIMLATTNLNPHLPYHVMFQIVVVHPMKYFTGNILCMVVDEGASTCMISLACGRPFSNPFCLCHLLFLQLSMVIRSNHMESSLISPCS
jgi:hypothetical protein